MRKFRSQLMLSYLPLVLVPVLLVGLVTRDAAEQGLSLLVRQDAQLRVEALAPCLGMYYKATGGWGALPELINHLERPALVPLPRQGDEGAGAMLLFRNVGWLSCWPVRLTGVVVVPGLSLEPSSPPETVHDDIGKLTSIWRAPEEQEPPRSLSVSPGVEIASAFSLREFRDRFGPQETIITDPEGIILASSSGQSVGKRLSADTLAHSAPIIVDDSIVGRVIVGTAFGAFNQSQQHLLNVVNAALVASGALSVFLAATLGWWMSWQIAQPVRQLMAGVRRLASGEWSTPLPVRSQNEFGDLTVAFNRMASEIMRQQQLNRQMIADIAHDLRTPLSTMSLEIEAIEAGFQTPAEATASLREEVLWLQRMVDDLRTLSLMDADQIRLQPEDRSLHEYLTSLFDFWRIMAEEEGRRFRLDVPGDLPIVPLDPGRMRQALGNLLDNAIQHTRPGDAITLRARAENEHVTIQVIDEGEGIPPEDLPHIFDRFYRVDPARRRDNAHNHSGSGLGLSIVKRLVEMHNGIIDTASVPGHGTTFTIRLPLGTSEREGAPA